MSPPPSDASQVTVDLTAVVIAVRDDEPCVLAVPAGSDAATASAAAALPAGPLQPGHRTLQAGLRSWVERQTRLRLGYVEQLYTFGDRPEPPANAPTARTISLAYLALVAEARTDPALPVSWRRWYDLLPWEDFRRGEPAGLPALREALATWVAAAAGPERRAREERLCLTFGLGDAAWDDERALERYELLYEAGLVPEAWHDRGRAVPEAVARLPGRPMAADHRRIVATAVSRVRGKIKYRPVLFELMPPCFTLLQLQRTAEALAGVRLHKQNFRRLVEQQGLVEETGRYEAETGGRPAKLMRFRPEVRLERPAPGVRLKATRRGSFH